MEKPKKKNTLKKIKKEVKKIKKEWNKAANDLKNFDPMKDMEMPDFSKQMKDSGFKINTRCDI